MLLEARAHVVLLSRNEAKRAAVGAAFARVLGKPFDLEFVTAPSGVRATPIGDEEAIEGCANRLRFAADHRPEATYHVALEGAVELRQHGTFIYGWAAVHEVSSRRTGLGCSAKVMLPAAIARDLAGGASMADLVGSLARGRTPDEVERLGANGLVTAGRFTRQDEFEGALACALGFLLTPNNFQ